MSDKPRVKGLIERKLEDPEYRKRFEEQYAAFKLEVQILLALEEKGWTYSDLAKATQTSKSNISRDLNGGGIGRASFSRLHRIAEALDMKLVSVMIPKESERFILPRIEALVRVSTSAAFVQCEPVGQFNQPTSLNDVFFYETVEGNFHSEINTPNFLIPIGKSTYGHAA